MAWRSGALRVFRVFRVFLWLSVILCCQFSWAQKSITFEKKNIVVGTKHLVVEIANTAEQVERGLMYRTRPLADNKGMLFEFKDVKVRSFWMKNTFIPLSIGFFDEKNRLISISEMKPVRSEMESPQTYSSQRPAKYALEVSPKWFKRHKIQLGTVFSYR